jgi:hypothetical protein
MVVHSNFRGKTSDSNVIYFNLEVHSLNFIKMNYC